MCGTPKKVACLNVGDDVYEVLTNFRIESARDNLCVKLVPIYLKIYANSLGFLNLKSGLIGRAAFLPRPNFFVSYIPEHKYYETYDDTK
ncbi:hypothetical protein NARC_90172 [Candidatus Nitrosocosmicus arcticus]|uniref:Uncharacterized protein n=1 Tax=Candidatus Nitrosocosmicus arcticus TaxID=2035267 RepID=A0A557SUI9_9ARCH|nr:hypothetical protein NARC_90172 [Candidatus Nitrosocosmicus arcticus]